MSYSVYPKEWLCTMPFSDLLLNHGNGNNFEKTNFCLFVFLSSSLCLKVFGYKYFVVNLNSYCELFIGSMRAIVNIGNF